MANIGEYVKSLRKARGYTQRKLGYLSGVSNATINRIENNISVPEPDTLKKLSHPLGVPYYDLLKAAGYLNEKRFLPDNIKLIRLRKGMTCSQLSEEIKKATGFEVAPETIERLESGKIDGSADICINAIAKYEGISPDFLFRENTPEDFEYAAGKFPFEGSFGEGSCLAHIKDVELRKWVCNPENLDYLAFAKKISSMGINPEFILDEFVFRIFRKKGNGKNSAPGREQK